MRRVKGKPMNRGKRLATQQSVNTAIKSVCDIMRRSDCVGVPPYVPELTWILFRGILDERERREAEDAEAVGWHIRHRWHPATAGKIELLRIMDYSFGE